MWLQDSSGDSGASKERQALTNGGREADSGRNHWGLMVLCCLSMIVISAVLLAGLWR
jgi:hypothetical protein